MKIYEFSGNKKLHNKAIRGCDDALGPPRFIQHSKNGDMYLEYEHCSLILRKDGEFVALSLYVHGDEDSSCNKRSILDINSVVVKLTRLQEICNA